MKTSPLALAVLCGAIALGQVATAAEDDDPPSSTKESKLTTDEFVKKAGESGAAEVEMGQMVAKKATDANVKAFAQRMVTDHTKANQELQAMAQSKDLKAPSSPGMMQKASMEKLKMHGASLEFDKNYMEHMVKDHMEDIELFQNAAASSKVDPQFQALAKKTLPMLESHLQSAQEIEEKL